MKRNVILPSAATVGRLGPWVRRIGVSKQAGGRNTEPVTPLLLARRGLGALALMLLTACAGAPTITNVAKTSNTYPKQNGKGVFYFLPRTELEVQLEITTEDVIRGPLTRYVESCPKTPEDPLCKAEQEFGFKPAKHEAEHKLCDTQDANGNVSVSRFYSLGDKTQVSGIAVPDPKQLYFVEVTPSWYQSITASLQYADSGLASEMTAGGSNAVAEAAIKTGLAIGSAALLAVRVAPAAVNEHEFFPAYAQIRSVKPTSADEDVRKRAVQELTLIKQRRDDILFKAPIGGDPTAILTALDARAVKIRELYEGKSKTDAVLSIRRVTLRPTQDSIDTDVAPLTFSTRAVQPVDIQVMIPGCANGTAAATKAAVDVRLVLDPEPNALEAALAQEASAPKTDSDQQGFRYRVPIPVRITLHQSNATVPSEDTRLINKEFAVDVAQLGPTLTLPRKAGLWGGTIGAAFIAHTGRLKTFKTDASSTLGTTIVNQIGIEAAKDRKMEALEKEEHELDLKAKIKAHTDALNPPANE